MKTDGRHTIIFTDESLLAIRRETITLRRHFQALSLEEYDEVKGLLETQFPALAKLLTLITRMHVEHEQET